MTKDSLTVELLFDAMKHGCRYHSTGIINTVLEACFHRNNIQKGSVCGECCFENCPLYKRRES